MYAPTSTWNLDTIVSGPVQAQPFQTKLTHTRRLAEDLLEESRKLGALDAAGDAWVDVIVRLWETRDEAHELYTVASGHWAADTQNSAARLATASVSELWELLEQCTLTIDAALDEASTEVCTAFLARPALTVYAPALHHLRAGASLRLSKDLESLYVQMRREALIGWGDLYNQLSGPLTAEYRGEPIAIAAASALRADPDEEVRRDAHESCQKAWQTLAGPCALTLTHITGARQTHYDRTGQDFLADTLHRNRVSRGILEGILQACEQMQPIVVRYLEHKAERLGKPQLDWWDLRAPLPAPSLDALSYSDAQVMIADAFGGFDPKMRAFAIHALKHQWVEVEKRPNKRQGGYCASLPRARQSRIFMTYSETVDSALTLAHELGHAYHNHILYNVPSPRRSITSALAETASTFAEAVMLDQILSRSDTETQVALLDQQLMNGVVFLMNIVARFRFEESLHALRREGSFDPAVLSETMVSCQRAAYGDSLASWDPTLWISKLHFYISHFGFYNWPYTFGYLFSSAVYERARQEGASFIPTFEELLRRTGWDETANIGSDVLGVDLESPDFWLMAAKPLEAQLERLIALR